MRHWCEAMCMASWAARTVYARSQRDGMQNKWLLAKLAMLACGLPCLSKLAGPGDGVLQRQRSVVLAAASICIFCIRA